MKDLYKQVPTPDGSHLETCPVCGSQAELWQYAEDDTSPTTKAVMCSHGDCIGPQEGMVQEGCPLFMAPADFYCATAREAIKYWNEYAKALNVLRRANNWKNHKVTRDTGGWSYEDKS